MAVGVKAHVLYSRLLLDDDYWDLLSSDTVSEIKEKLMSTAYGEFLETIPAETHRRDLESAIHSTIIAQGESFLFHMSSPRDKFFKTLMYQYEADGLKSVFRHIASGRTDREKLRQRLNVSRHSLVSFDNMLSARNFSEASDVLRNTPYYRSLAEPLRRLHSGEERSLFPLEAALDMFVESSRNKALEKLEPAERNRLLPIFGARVDLYNIYILYRALAYYNLTPEETLNRLLPAKYRVAMPVLRGLVRAGALPNLTEMLRGRFPAYAELLSSALSDENPELALDSKIKRYIYAQAKSVFDNGPPGFHTAVAYYILKQFEITDLTRIIEYVRYAHDRRSAAVYLTKSIAAAGGEHEWQ
ncbi:MAG: V-type ATPase subunit [Synergistaceae bacterium]|jgi:V/A-type H+-transporting ATPase subunit C|nr:V-type ATPase subunit [Synergistaceae bacterium]